MAKQTFTSGQVLTAAEMNSLQENDYNWTVTTKTASYTLAAGDEGTRIVMNNAGATTITVDDAVFAAGDVVWLHNIGAGTCTVTAGTATVSTVGDLALAQYAGGHLYFTSASAAIFFPTEQGGGGKILQVVSAEKTDTFSTSSTSFVDLTGLSASITPSSTSSKIFVIVTAHGASDDASGGTGIYFKLLRGATHIGAAASPSNRTPVNGLITNEGFATLFGMQSCAFSVLDNPATTSATTYKVQVKTTANTIYVNRSSNDVDNGLYARSVSTITLYEVSA